MQSETPSEHVKLKAQTKMNSQIPCAGIGLKLVVRTKFWTRFWTGFWTRSETRFGTRSGTRSGTGSGTRSGTRSGTGFGTRSGTRFVSESRTEIWSINFKS